MKDLLLLSTPLPQFSKMVPESIEPTVEEALMANRAQLKILLKNKYVTWENFIVPLEEMADNLDRLWAPIAHLNAVMNSEPLRHAYHACLSKLTDYHTEIGQNELLYQAYSELTLSKDYSRLSGSQKKVIENVLRDFHLSGVTLPPAEKQRYAEIQKQLALLSSKFEENLLDATDKWLRHVTNLDELKGLPSHALQEAKAAAQQRQLEGWVLTLETPCYIEVMTYADDRALRREIYEAYITRASDQGPHGGCWDNSKVMHDILTYRQEEARLLGFKNYAELSLAANKMAKTTEEVLTFLTALLHRARDAAKKEFAELTLFAKEKYSLEALQPWDISYFSEKLLQHRYAISQEEIRPYFPADHVIHGLFSVAKRLFGVSITEVSGIDVWHPEVKFYEVCDSDNRLRGQFYLDLFARPHKRGGAWMDDCHKRWRRADGIQIPIAFLTCNFTRAIDDKPALLTHEEVITLFHEFGHGLHHILTLVDYPSISGTQGVSWDAVEMPSQLLENWCWNKEALDVLSCHYITQKSLPEEMLQKMLAAKNFHSAMQIVRQLEFAFFDFRLHMEFDAQQPGQIQKILDEVRAAVSVVPVASFNRFQHGFSHVFAGGYAAGYYSYKWAEVLSSDAFAKFEEKGIFDHETGAALRRIILESGGMRDFMELFIEFRGRVPNIDALLRHSGLE